MFWGDTIQHMTQGDPERRGDDAPSFSLLLPPASPPFPHSGTCSFAPSACPPSHTPPVFSSVSGAAAAGGL